MIRGLRKNGGIALLGLALAAFLLRAWGVSQPGTYIGDEYQFIPSSEQYFQNGQFRPNQWFHPPFSLFVTRAGMALFGDNSYGWRMMNVLFGSLTVLVLALLARELSGDLRVSLLAGLLLCFEPLHILMSRTNFMEVAPILFFLLAVYAVVRYVRDESRSLLWAGVPLGLSLAGKWYYLPALPAVIAFAAAMVLKARKGVPALKEVGYILACCLVVPAGVYVLAYAPWFQKGGSFPEFLLMQRDAYRALQTIGLETFVDDFFRASPTSPGRWFIVPLVHGVLFDRSGAWGRFFVFMNDPPVWLLAVPACLFMAWRAARTRDPFLGLPLVLLLVTYLQFIAVQRPVFLYSALVVLPFVFLAVSYFLVALCERSGRARPAYGVLAAFVCLWGMYLYPFVTGRAVPIALYVPLQLLSRGISGM
jgi:dolichyl-phosphate-mannose--protein O-mannosyl transferase